MPAAAPTPSTAGSLARFAPWAAEEGARIYLCPVGLLPVSAWADGAAVPLAGGRFAFTQVELLVRHGDRVARACAPLTEAMAWGWERGRSVAQALDRRLAALTRSRPPFAGLPLDGPRLMGVINVTPDSFSDGGEFAETAAAIAHGEALRAAGADILDVGGESTRPGAAPVSAEEEIARVLPVVRALAAAGAVVSADTRNAATMAAALAAGASVVNDISGLTGDPEALRTVAAAGASVVLMHMRGEPGTMQDDPVYRDAALDVFDWLDGRVAACVAAGIPPERIAVDPGIGFGKTVEHNLRILRLAALYHGLGCAVLFGVSRKSTIGRLSRGEPPKRRLPGSLALGLAAWNAGVQVLRVHDVAETDQARAVWSALHPPAGAPAAITAR